ncbi:MAG TPA: lanthionine synthetase C family protein [Acidimicrobiales bacterium]
MSGSYAGWGPVLFGADAEHALALAEGIAAALRAPENQEHVSALGPSYSGGWMGIALALDATGDREGALHLAERAIDWASAASFDPRLYIGDPGIAFSLDVLAGDEADDEDGDVDEALAKLVTSASPWPGSYDLIHGIVGIGTYALSRLRRVADPDRSTNRWTAEQVVERLGELATDTPAGTTWVTRIETLPVKGDRADRYPDGYYDMGLAHGIAGVVTFLAGATAAGVPGASDLLERAVPWVLEQGANGSYPLLFGPGDPPQHGRIAWCYGDPSVAIALLAAGRALGADDVVDAARRLTRLAAARPREASGVVDAMLCHGSAGLGHLFNRLAHQLGDDQVEATARGWYLAAIAAHDASVALGGFLGFRPPREGHPGGYAPVAGLLEGSAGVALTFVAAATGADPVWDELFLLRPVAEAGR